MTDEGSKRDPCVRMENRVRVVSSLPTKRLKMEGTPYI